MPSPDSFRAARWIRTLNLVLQAVLFLTFFGGLNYVARNYPLRFDLTRLHQFSLSPETLSYVRNLQRPVDITVTLADENDSPEVRGLLDEFVHASEGNPAGRITTRYIDVYQDRRKAEDLGIETPNVVLLRSGDKTQAVKVEELYRIKNKVREAFEGEQALTTAILNVSSNEQQRLYFLTGHGELEPNDSNPARGLSLVKNELRGRGFEIDSLNLTAARKIPPQASLLVAVSPQTRYTPVEQQMLREYLSVQAGRLLLFLAPGMSAGSLGLDELLLDWGVLVDDDLVIDPAPEAIAEDFDLIIWSFDPVHPVAQPLVGRRLPLRLSAARTVRADPGLSKASGYTVVPIAAVTKSAWGEVNYRQPPPVLDSNDIRPMKGIPPDGQLSIVVASERVSVRDNLPFSVKGGRLVVFGTGDLISNQRVSHFGNFASFLGAVNWMVDREHQLSVPARPIERFQLALSGDAFMKLRYALVLGLPGATLLLGLIVYWTRRT
ncbi:MAG TPA: GldG family protein [Opitutaceae bacterium]|nr:GldG family protein [Opitutaceae bacterium]